MNESERIHNERGIAAAGRRDCKKHARAQPERDRSAAGRQRPVVSALLAASLIAAGLCVWASAESVRADDSGAAGSAAPAVDAPEEMQTLATLELGLGQELAFLGNADGDVAVREVVPVGGAVVSLDREGKLIDDIEPVELYIALTPAGRAIPRALLASEMSPSVAALAAERPIVERLEPLPGGMQLLRKKDVDVYHMPELCGASGAAEFQQICDANASWGDQRWCEPYLHPWFAKSSSGKKKVGAGITVACNSSVQTKIKRKVGGIWYTTAFNLDAPNYLMITRVWYTFKYYRFVGHYSYNQTNTSNHWIRSWIGFD